MSPIQTLPPCSFCGRDCWRTLVLTTIPETVASRYITGCARRGLTIPTHVSTCTGGQSVSREWIGVSWDDAVETAEILAGAEDYLRQRR